MSSNGENTMIHSKKATSNNQSLSAMVVIASFMGSAILLLAGYFLISEVTGQFGVQDEVDRLESQAAQLEKNVSQLQADLAYIKANPVLSLETEQVTAEQAEIERLMDKFRRGVYDEETISFVFKEADMQLKTYAPPFQPSPYDLADFSIQLATKLDYLATGMEKGLVDATAVERLVRRYEAGKSHQYVSELTGTHDGGYLDEILDRIRYFQES